MICYVDMAHPDLLADPERRGPHLARRLDTALRLQEIAGVPCLYQGYRAIEPAFVRRWGLRALVLSGIPSHWRAYDWGEFGGLVEIIRAGDVPILGMCGGAQVIGKLLGAPVTRLGRLPPGEADAGEYMPGWRKEWGFLPVETVAPDPLFAGLGARPVMFLAHGRALKAIPPGCTLLATTPTCRIQTFRLDGTRVYGVQFHPELYTDEHPDGRRLLANFFALAGFSVQLGP
jgi:GMP synthase-like glutamine amidotransferase